MGMNHYLKAIKFVVEPLKKHKIYYLIYSVGYDYQLLHNWFDDMKCSK